MAKTIATWVLTVPVCGLFLLAGAFKFSAQAIENFANLFGYSDEFRIFIGVAELLGAIGVLVPRLASWAGAGLAVIMGGAVYTHVQVGEPIWTPAFAGAACIAIAVLRRDRALGLAAGDASVGAEARDPGASARGDRPAA